MSPSHLRQNRAVPLKIPSDISLSSVLHKVNDHIVLVGPARNRLQSGSGFAAICSIVMLLLLCGLLVFSDHAWDESSREVLLKLGIFSFLVTIAVTQLLYRRSFLFQGGPTYAVFDRRNQLGYWSRDGQLRPVAWKEIRFDAFETCRRLQVGQWLHQHFLRLECSGPAEGGSVDVPVIQALDNSLGGTMLVSRLNGALRSFMNSKSAVGAIDADIADLRRQSQGGICQSIGSWVIPPHESITAHPWSFLFGVLSLPFAILFFGFNAFYAGAVRITSTPARWPDELLAEVGSVPTGSLLQAIVASKV